MRNRLEFNEETATYGIVHLVQSAPTARSAVIYFANYCSGESACSYQTTPFKLEGSNAASTSLVVEQVAKSLAVESCYREHIEWLRVQNVEAKGRLGPDELARRHELENQAILTGKIAAAEVARTGDGSYRYRVWPLLTKAVGLLAAGRTQLKYLNQPLPPAPVPKIPALSEGLVAADHGTGHQSPTGQSGVEILQAVPTESEVLEAEIEEFRRQRSSNQGTNGHIGWKTFWFALSVLAFIAIGGYHWSMQVAAVLAAVVLFHEFGHFVAMWLVGYRDLRILFIPMAGAVAMGREDQSVAPWKQLVVLYAGPIPGLLVAFAMIGWQAATGYQSELFTQLLTFLLILNLFNLLPIYPLDGGQIFAVTFFGRFPFLKMFFVAGSVVMLALAWLVTQIVVFGILAVIIGLTLIAEYQMAQTISRTRSRLPRNFDRNDEALLLREIFRELKEPSIAKQKAADRMTLARKLLNDLQQKPAGFLTITGSVTAYTLPLWAPLLVLAPAAHFAHQEHLAKREAMIGEGWPADIRSLVIEVGDTENALPHLQAAHELIEANEETAALVREIRQTVEGFVYDGFPLTERQRNGLRERLAAPEVRGALEEIMLAASKPHLEDPDWYQEAFIASFHADLPFDPSTAVNLLAASVLAAESDDRWQVYLSLLRLSNLLAHHAVPGVRLHTYMTGHVTTSLASDLYRDRSLPSDSEATAILEELRRLAHGTEADRQRRLHANFALISLTHDPFAYLPDDQREEYRAQIESGFFYRLGKALRSLNLSAFSRVEDLKRLEAMQSAQLPIPLPNRYEFGGNSWSWILDIGHPMPVKRPLSWPDLINYEVACFTALFHAADFLYRVKGENGDYPLDARELWEAMADAAPYDPFTGERLAYRRTEEGFELFGRSPSFYLLNEPDDDPDEYDQALFHTYWKGPDATFRTWD